MATMPPRPPALLGALCALLVASCNRDGLTPAMLHPPDGGPDLAVADLVAAADLVAPPDLIPCPGQTPGKVQCGNGVCAAKRCAQCVRMGMVMPVTCYENLAPPTGAQCFSIACDGVEDCGKGEVCVRFEGTHCTVATNAQQSPLVCHGDCDCPPHAPHCDPFAGGLKTCICKADRECPRDQPHCAGERGCVCLGDLECGGGRKCDFGRCR